jgi:hypothetical protein
MGVRGLLTFCKVNKIIRTAKTPITPQRIGVDAFSLFYLFQEQREEFEQYIQNLLKIGSVTIVLDRRASKEKAQVVHQRKEARATATSEVQTLMSTIKSVELEPQQVKILEKQLEQQQRKAWCLYPEYMSWALAMFERIGATVVKAEQEADEVLAEGEYTIVVSSDSDLLILGVERLWIPGARGGHSEITRGAFEKLIGLQGNQLYELAFLAGCDVQCYSYLPIPVAVSRLKFYKSLEKVAERFPDLEVDLDLFRRLRGGVWSQDLPLRSPLPS